jgi:tetratricopeptide (TPR) repeat protein
VTDDVVGAGWQLDPATRSALRLDRARRSMWCRDFRDAVVELEELLDEDHDHVEALRALAESLMELGEFAGAAAAWDHLERLGASDPALRLQAAWCAYETCDFEAAQVGAQQAAADAPYLAEAWFLLGLCADRADDFELASRHHDRAHRLSPRNHPYPLQLDDLGWAEVVTEAFQSLPPDLQEFWNGTPVRLEQLPTDDDLRGTDPPLSPRVVALYEGEPPDEAGGTERPAAVRVFRRNLAYAESIDSLIDQLSWTQEQEALDWLGVEE